MRSRRIAALASTGGVVVVALALAPAAGAGAPSAFAAASCSPVSNIEAIVDDSASMQFTDADKLRVEALDLLIDTPGNEKITLGASEFGGQFGTFPGQPPAADTVFAPQTIGPNAAAMKAALTAKVVGDNGVTDYNAAFAQAKADDPGAKAWIFLTDGGHDVGDYMNGHQGGPPTYVIGFSGATIGENGARLKQIAKDTGGKAFLQTDSSNLQAVMNEVGTTLTCQSPPKTFKDAFTKPAQSHAHAVTIASKATSAQLTLSWTSPLDQFAISQVRVVRDGKVVAVVSKKRHLKLTVRHGATFLVVKVGNLTRGSLRFSVRATKIGSGAPQVKLTTQVTQTRHR